MMRGPRRELQTSNHGFYFGGRQHHGYTGGRGGMAGSTTVSEAKVLMPLKISRATSNMKAV